MQKPKIIQAGIYGFMSLYGNYLRESTIIGTREPDWISRHTLEFFLAAECTAIGLMVFKNKYLRLASVLVPPMLGTNHEINNLLYRPDHYDPQDIMCFWAGSITALGITKLIDHYTTRNKTRINLEEKVQA
ncbi:hypothetical protein HZA97_08545 [Candidatus Woesearchaeota archaeon]|nr:hypothetical protein [Candidatus Woesearchaeota archaeon]